MLRYLNYENVHFAVDPEFKIPKHIKYPPGKYLGFISAHDLNKAQELMNNYIIEKNIKGKRNLIVHMFRKKMLRKRDTKVTCYI